jgi:hypothetical protein
MKQISSSHIKGNEKFKEGIIKIKIVNDGIHIYLETSQLVDLRTNTSSHSKT